jgi:hypothetical protein
MLNEVIRVRPNPILWVSLQEEIRTRTCTHTHTHTRTHTTGKDHVKTWVERDYLLAKEKGLSMELKGSYLAKVKAYI